MEDEFFIDIDRIIASKSPNLQKRLPRFIVNYLKRTIHQDELNNILRKYGKMQGVEFIQNVFNDMQVKYTVSGHENIPTEGRYIFASNHPLGGLDGMVLIHLLGQKYESVKFPVNDFLMHVKPLQCVFLPVNKVGAQSVSTALQIESAYASSAQILYFPAGLCSRKQKGGVIEDVEWKKSFVAKAVEYKRNVVPVYFEGRNSSFFYNLARIRKVLGIRFNIEMLYLVDEMFKQKGRPIQVKFGKQIDYEVFDRSKSAKEWAAWVKDLVYTMQ